MKMFKNPPALKQWSALFCKFLATFLMAPLVIPGIIFAMFLSTGSTFWGLLLFVDSLFFHMLSFFILLKTCKWKQYNDVHQLLDIDQKEYVLPTYNMYKQ